MAALQTEGKKRTSSSEDLKKVYALQLKTEGPAKWINFTLDSHLPGNDGIYKNGGKEHHARIKIQTTKMALAKTFPGRLNC